MDLKRTYCLVSKSRIFWYSSFEVVLTHALEVLATLKGLGEEGGCVQTSFSPFSLVLKRPVPEYHLVGQAFIE